VLIDTAKHDFVLALILGHVHSQLSTAVPFMLIEDLGENGDRAQRNINMKKKMGGG